MRGPVDAGFVRRSFGTSLREAHATGTESASSHCHWAIVLGWAQTTELAAARRCLARWAPGCSVLRKLPVLHWPVEQEPVRLPLVRELVPVDRSSAWLRAPPERCRPCHPLSHRMPAQRLGRRCRLAPSPRPAAAERVLSRLGERVVSPVGAVRVLSRLGERVVSPVGAVRVLSRLGDSGLWSSRYLGSNE
jgi:hypothetical protein